MIGTIAFYILVFVAISAFQIWMITEPRLSEAAAMTVAILNGAMLATTLTYLFIEMGLLR